LQDPIFKIKKIARNVVSKCIYAGILIKQPCEVCNMIETVEAHHDDYHKPLDVRWLCRKHHVEHHTEDKGTKL